MMPRILLLLVSLLPLEVWGATLEELQSAGRLTVSAELIPATGIVPGQKVELAISIATDRWFAGGTRLAIPEVPGLVILQTNNFASNASESRGGHNWVVQRWSLDIYPQRAGTFTVPPVAVTIQVNDEESGNIAGVLTTPALKFQAVVPGALSRAESWVAAPKYTVSQSFDREIEHLQVGDAFEREIVFEASDVMAMMLPTFTATAQPGLAAYPQPVTLTNSSNRGTTVARRVERITYIVEQAGQYRLPAHDYYWWDTRTNELQIRFLPAVDIRAGGATTAGRFNSDTAVSLAKVFAFALLVVLALTGAGLARHHVPHTPLAMLTGRVQRIWQRLKKLWAPALPATLNPESTAGERKAGAPR